MIYQSSVDRCNSRLCVIFDEQIVLIVVNKATDQYKFVNMTNIWIYCYGVFSKFINIINHYHFVDVPIYFNQTIQRNSF